MATGVRVASQLVVVTLGVFFFVDNVVDEGVTPWDFLPLIAMGWMLFAIERIRGSESAASEHSWGRKHSN
jgi:hypothetical protein